MYFPKKDIIPLLVPPILFTDNDDHTNAFVEMNPSLFIEANGDVTLLVRCVDYKKFPNKHFTLHQAHSNSEYYVVKGKISDTHKVDLEHFEYQRMETLYQHVPRYPSYWRGVEDVRFVDSKTLLVTVPELNKDGIPSIFKAALEDHRMTNFTPCLPHHHSEKNWMPFTYNGRPNVIYSVSPFLVKSVECDDRQPMDVSETVKQALEGYHGSTNGIPFFEGYFLFLVHVNREKTYHRMMLFHPETKDIRVSEEFTFFRNSYIEFPCSLCSYHQRIFITLGVNDDKAFLLELCMKDIELLFSKK